MLPWIKGLDFWEMMHVHQISTFQVAITSQFIYYYQVQNLISLLSCSSSSPTWKLNMQQQSATPKRTLHANKVSRPKALGQLTHWSLHKLLMPSVMQSFWGNNWKLDYFLRNRCYMLQHECTKQNKENGSPKVHLSYFYNSNSDK
jgi:hypothetical protein